MRARFLSVLSFVAGILFCFGAVIVLLNGFGAQSVVIAVSALVSLFASACFLVQYFFAKGEILRGGWTVWSIALYAVTGVLLFGCISSPLMRAADLIAAFSVFLGINRISAFLQLKKQSSQKNWTSLLFGVLSALAGGIYFFLPVFAGYLLNFFIALFLILEGIYCGSIWLFTEREKNA